MTRRESLISTVLRVIVRSAFFQIGSNFAASVVAEDRDQPASTSSKDWMRGQCAWSDAPPQVRALSSKLFVMSPPSVCVSRRLG